MLTDQRLQAVVAKASRNAGAQVRDMQVIHMAATGTAALLAQVPIKGDPLLGVRKRDLIRGEGIARRGGDGVGRCRRGDLPVL